jgi:hypothetical protein
LKFVGHVTDNYVRQIIWDTVQYRWKKYCFSYIVSEIVSTTVWTGIIFATNLYCICPT